MNSGELQSGQCAFALHVPAGARVVVTVSPQLGAPAAEESVKSPVLRFWRDWNCMCLPLPLCAARTESLFAAYELWSRLQGLRVELEMPEFVVTLVENGARKARKRTSRPVGKALQVTVAFPPGLSERGYRRQDVDADVSRFDVALSAWADLAAES